MPIDRSNLPAPLPFTQGHDGVPHMSYYTEELSFLWDGAIGEKIQVSYEGYAEPVRWTFDIREYFSVVLPLTDFSTALMNFQSSCDGWLDAVKNTPGHFLYTN